MKIKNVWKNVEEPLELHTDDRGSIVDVFYNDNIEHVAIVDSEPNVLRGNHYHKETYILHVLRASSPAMDRRF